MAEANFNDYVRLVRGFNTFSNLMQCDCINGYAVGRKYTKGRPLDQYSIIVYVNKKLSLRRLPISNRIPKRLSIPTIDGTLDFTTDVQEARFSALSYTNRERPAPSGISIGHVNISAGTLGGLVYDKLTNNTVILSNNHVIADGNEAAVGDAILQPGPADGGTFPNDHIANLTRFVPIDYAEDAENRVDGAIATPLDLKDLTWFTRDIGAENPSSIRILNEGDLGLPVRKTGRTTEHTTGFVEALFARIQVKYSLFQKANFVDQIIVSQLAAEEDFSSGGDSGSLVYDWDQNCVGLLFAGSEASDETAATTIINPISFVLSQLNIEFLPSGAHPSPDPVS